MPTLSSIKRLYSIIDNSVFMTTGSLDYNRVTDAVIKLSEVVLQYPGDNDDLWYIGEYRSCNLADFIVGAYWHYTEWHNGQWSPGYAALSSLGQVYDPNMERPDPENQAYTSLNDMASTHD